MNTTEVQINSNPIIENNIFKTWTEKIHRQIESGKLNFDKKQFLRDTDIQYSQFQKLANWMEDICDYVFELEQQVEYLNIRLADNTPEHARLINDFIDQEVRESEQRSWSSIQESRRSIEYFQAELDNIKKRSEERFADILSKIKRQELSQSLDFDNLKNALTHQFLPYKLMEDRKQYYALSESGEWIEINEMRFLAIYPCYKKSDPNPLDDTILYTKEKTGNEIFFNFL
jgi:hypothetical protein